LPRLENPWLQGQPRKMQFSLIMKEKMIFCFKLIDKKASGKHLTSDIVGAVAKSHPGTKLCDADELISATLKHEPWKEGGTQYKAIS
jgi:hypothetical protein